MIRFGPNIRVLLAAAVAFAAPLRGQEMNPEKTYPLFALGPTGAHLTIEPGLRVTVRDVDEDSPAAAGGLKVGDVVRSIGGAMPDVDDPRRPLGHAIGLAESDDGILELGVERGADTLDLRVTIPALGAYRVTWPERCPKSQAIVATTAGYVASCQQDDGNFAFGDEQAVRDDLRGCLAGLFLLSTGEDRFLENVRLQARALAVAVGKRPTTSNWHLGYQGILLAEYYLRTGDREVLAGLKALCDQAVSAEVAGGWGHGGVPNPGYVQSGLMSSAGVPVLATLILARECGVPFDEASYVRAVKFMYRMVGHGNVPYGDHRSELWWSNTNGRNAMLACAFSLLDEPRFQEAARHLALLVADSYHQPEFGHTGGGFNVIWRGLASVHVPEARRTHYQRQMKELAWYYDLCRQPGGGFSILPTPPDNTRYCGLAWGTGAVGLTYTAPRATLRITGAPRTRFSVETPPLDFEWGTEADHTFFSTGDAEGFGGEELSPAEVYDHLLGKGKDTADAAFCRKYLRHFSPMVRSWAARRLGQLATDEALEVLEEAVGHPDPRVRRAGFDGISGYDNWSRPLRSRLDPDVVSERFLPAIRRTLGNPDAAWWELDGALFALGRARPDDIREALPLLRRFAGHPEWYLREATFWAITGLGDSITGDEFLLLSGIYGRSRHVFARSSFDAGFRTLLKDNKVTLGHATLMQAAGALGRTTHDPGVVPGYGEGGVHEAAHRTLMILEHFGPEIYPSMAGDLAAYVEIWEPYFQHSIWMIGGSKWQRGILQLVAELGEPARPIVDALESKLEAYGSFDPKRIPKDGRQLDERIREAVEDWRKRHDPGE